MDDGLPDKICGNCVQSLNKAYFFKQQCERVDKELRGNNALNRSKDTCTARRSRDSMPDITSPLKYTSTPLSEKRQNNGVQVNSIRNQILDLTNDIQSEQSDVQRNVHTVNEPNYVKHVPSSSTNVSNTPVITCRGCFKKIESTEYKSHLRICSQLKGFSCVICRKVLKTKETLKHHINNVHKINHNRIIM